MALTNPLTIFKLNKGGFRRLYRFELFIGTSRKPKHVFNFITGPQSYSINEGTRTSLQKTFGGTYLDDFGEDNKQISLSGDFGLNQFSVGWDDKRVGRNIGALAGLKYFRDKFVRSYEWAKPSEDVRVKFYDLCGEIEKNVDGWYVNINKFSINRDAGSTFQFKWSMDLTVLGKGWIEIVPKSDGLHQVVHSNLSYGQGLFAIASAIDNVVSIFKPQGLGVKSNLYTFKKEKPLIPIADILDNVNNALDSVTDAVSDVLAVADALSDSIDGFSQLANQAINVFNLCNSTVNAIRSTTGNVLDSVANSTDLINNTILAVDDLFRNTASLFDPTAPGSFSAVWHRSMSKIQNNFRIINAMAQAPIGGAEPYRNISTREQHRINLENEQAVAIGNDQASGNDNGSIPKEKTMVRTTRVNFPTGMTPSQIALQIYGDAIFSFLIQNANPGINFEARSKTLLNIPTLMTREEVATLPNRYIFDKNPNGKDISVDPDNFIMIGSSGDARLVSDGVNIIAQLNRQIQTEIGSLGSDQNYGLDFSIGEVGGPDRLLLLQSRIEAILAGDERFGADSIVESITDNQTGTFIELRLFIGVDDPIKTSLFIAQKR